MDAGERWLTVNRTAGRSLELCCLFQRNERAAKPRKRQYIHTSNTIRLAAIPVPAGNDAALLVRGQVAVVLGHALGAAALPAVVAAPAPTSDFLFCTRAMCGVERPGTIQ